MGLGYHSPCLTSEHAPSHPSRPISSHLFQAISSCFWPWIPHPITMGHQHCALRSLLTLILLYFWCFSGLQDRLLLLTYDWKLLFQTFSLTFHIASSTLGLAPESTYLASTSQNSKYGNSEETKFSFTCRSLILFLKSFILSHLEITQNVTGLAKPRVLSQRL